LGSQKLAKKPTNIYILVLLHLSLSVIFIAWGHYATIYLSQIPSWQDELSLEFIGFLYWVVFIGTLVWLGTSLLFMGLSYGLYKQRHRAWTISMILTTLGLVVFSIMLLGFIVTSLMFKDTFSITGLITDILALLIDISIVYLLTRPSTKQYFNVTAVK
jgi:hypothetical protein